MLVNFALDCLGTKVTCDKVSCDGYEPRNLLLHNNVGFNHQGFLADYFIKPPVTLTFQFPCPVSIRNINLNPKVGSQRSSFIEIYTAASSKRQRYSPASIGVVTNTVQSGESSDLQNSAEPVFKKIGSIRCMEPGDICFYNPRFQNESPLPADHHVDSCFHRAELHHPQYINLASVQHLAVRIVGTANSTTAAIGKLEVWGTPARSCSPALKEDIIHKYTSAIFPQRQPRNNLLQKSKTPQSSYTKPDSTCKSQYLELDKGACRQKEDHQLKTSTNSMESSVKNSDSETSTLVPDDFLDALTFEIMSMPMLLPSGQTVDLSTLDKFSEEEANYGRQPSDPFTGLTFTATRKPMINMPLKTRIDQFLVKHADEPSLHHVPRALGHSSLALSADHRAVKYRSSLVCSPSGSKTVSNRKRSLEDTSECNHGAGNQNPFPFYLPGSSFTHAFTPSHKKIKTDRNIAACTDNKDSSAGSDSLTNKATMVTNAESHEERLKSSLSSSLASVLGNLPSFTPISEHSTPTLTSDSLESNEQCSMCRRQLNDSGVTSSKEQVIVYKFPCQHLVCRMCLFKPSSCSSTEVTCCVCCKRFPRADLIRTHL